MTLEVLRKDARAKALGDSSNTKLSNDDCDRYLNQYLARAGEIAEKNGGDWQPFGEIVTIDIIEDPNSSGTYQKEYLLTDTDVNLRRIHKVFIKASSDADDYTVGTKFDITGSQNDLTDMEVDYPTYDLFEDSIFIVLPDSTQTAITAGIKIYCSTDLTELSATSDIPQLPTVIHKYLSVGAAFEYCMDNQLYKKADRLENRLEKLEAEIAEHYSSRSETKPLMMTPAERNYY